MCITKFSILVMVYTVPMTNRPTHRLLALPRVRGWMKGYYSAQIEQRKALADIPLSSMSPEYIRELAVRAERETSKLSTPYIKNTNKY